MSGKQMRPGRKSTRGNESARRFVRQRLTDTTAKANVEERTNSLRPAHVGASFDYEWVVRFQDLVKDRKMMAALTLFREQPRRLEDWPVKGSYSLQLLESAARLLDRNREHFVVLTKRIAEFRQAIHFGQLSVEDATRLKLAEAIVLFHSELFSQVVEPLKLVRTMADDCGNDDLRAMARYYLARVLYRIGKIDEAKEVISEAERLIPNAAALPSLQMVKIWILFNEESVDEAESTLKRVERAIKGKDYIEDVNIVTLWGRFARQQGAFQDAIEFARNAIKIFDDNGDAEHYLCARAMVHEAFAILLHAQEKNLRSNADELDLVQRRSFDCLDEAEKLCGNHKRVLERVHYFRACWYFYLGQIAKAKASAIAAYQAAEPVADHVIMAHALILQCKCARSKSDSHEARTLAFEAQQEAEKTDNRRVRARAHIWVGMTQADPPLNNHKVACANLEAAKSLLRTTDRDYLLWECKDLEMLVAACQKKANLIVFPEVTIDEVLRDGSLKRTSKRLATPICVAVVQRLGGIRAAAGALQISRNTVKTHLKGANGN
jgi:tetratricopeptide (TPR) repeat protein